MSALAEAPTPSKRRKHRYISKKLDQAKATELRQRGLTVTEIAQHQGVAPSTVWRFLERTKPEVQALEQYKSGRADVLAALGADAIEVQTLALKALKEKLGDGVSCTLEPGQITKILQASAMAHGIGFDKERLERGESTQNISTVSRMLDSRLGGLHKRNLAITNKVDEAER